MPFLNLNAKLVVTLIETTTYNNNKCLQYVRLFEILVAVEGGGYLIRVLSSDASLVTVQFLLAPICFFI